MSSEWAVLHLTDFHIANPSGDDEHLRNGFYREYLDDLASTINDALDKKIKIALVAITGDFVHEGNTGNLDHATKVINYLCSVLGIGRDRVFVCAGNHDVDLTSEKSGDSISARRDFKSFADQFGNGSVRTQFCSASGALSHPISGVHVVVIDSTRGANGENRAGTITGAEIDEVICAVRDASIKDDELLVVLSHHPVCSYITPDAPFDEANTGWAEKHMWLLAQPLYTRLGRSRHSVLWLSGDIHRQAHVIDGAVHSVVTGRFGASTSKATSQVMRQARIVLMKPGGDSASWLCEFSPSGHSDQAQIGEWQTTYLQAEKHNRVPRVVRRTDFPSEPSCVLSEKQTVNTAGKAAEEDGDGACPVLKDPEVEVFSNALQTKMLELIAEERLYYMGRYATCDSKTTLGWVPINILLDQGEMLPAIITEMSKWLKSKLSEQQFEDPVIIGIDSWGGILASQLSVMTGVRNFCIAGRARGITHTIAERISDTVKEGVFRSDFVVLVSDVIGTGKSLKFVQDQLEEKMSAKHKKEVSWVLMSLLCDEGTNREGILAFAKGSATACKSLRIPIVDNTELPNEAILPADISFARR